MSRMFREGTSRSAHEPERVAPTSTGREAPITAAGRRSPMGELSVHSRRSGEVIDVGVPGRDIVEWRTPRADAVADCGPRPSIIVLHTHDYELAACLAWPLWRAEHHGPLSRPQRCWWRQFPNGDSADPNEPAQIWWPAPPGAPGAIPLVRFPAEAPDDAVAASL